LEEDIGIPQEVLAELARRVPQFFRSNKKFTRDVRAKILQNLRIYAIGTEREVDEYLANQGVKKVSAISTTQHMCTTQRTTHDSQHTRAQHTHALSPFIEIEEDMDRHGYAVEGQISKERKQKGRRIWRHLEEGKHEALHSYPVGANLAN